MNSLSRLILSLALADLGVHEVGGNNRGPQIETWLSRVGQPPGKAWCAAWLWCKFDDACKSLGIKNPVRASASVLHMWEALPDSCKQTGPAPGLAFFHLSDPKKGTGHCGYVTSVDTLCATIATVEGNTNAKGSREGDSVAKHSRPIEYVNLGYADLSALAAAQGGARS